MGIKTKTSFNSETASEAGKKSKREPFDKKMQEWLQEEMSDGMTVEDAFRKALLKYGLKGNIYAIKEAFDRAYGKAKNSIVFPEGIPDQNINITVAERKHLKKQFEFLKRPKKK